MSAIETIGNALAYDAAEMLLASGAPLSAAYRLVIAQADIADDDEAALSVAPTQLATLRPSK